MFGKISGGGWKEVKKTFGEIHSTYREQGGEMGRNVGKEKSRSRGGGLEKG